MSTRFRPVLFLLLLLAAIGFLHQLLADPLHLMLVIGLTALLLFAVHRYLTTGRFLPNVRKFGQGARKKQPQPGRSTKKGASARKRVAFQVIEGNKGKNKPPEEGKRLP